MPTQRARPLAARHPHLCALRSSLALSRTAGAVRKPLPSPLLTHAAHHYCAQKADFHVPYLRHRAVAHHRYFLLRRRRRRTLRAQASVFEGSISRHRITLARHMASTWRKAARSAGINVGRAAALSGLAGGRRQSVGMLEVTSLCNNNRYARRVSRYARASVRRDALCATTTARLPRYIASRLTAFSSAARHIGAASSARACAPLNALYRDVNQRCSLALRLRLFFLAASRIARPCAHSEEAPHARLFQMRGATEGTYRDIARTAETSPLLGTSRGRWAARIPHTVRASAARRCDATRARWRRTRASPRHQ